MNVRRSCFRRSGAHRSVALALCVVTALAVPAARAAAAVEKPYGGATPQDTVARMKAAAQTGDLGELLACLAPDDRKAMGAGMLMMTVMMVGFSQMAGGMAGDMAEGMAEAFSEDGEGLSAEQKAEIEAGQAEAAAEAAKLMTKLRGVLEPHGLAGLIDGAPEEGSAEDLAMTRALDQADMVVLTQDLMALLSEMDDDDEGDGSPADDAKPPWIDREVTGWQIEGDRATAQAGEDTLELVRVDGRWYLSLPDEDQIPGESEGEGEDENDWQDQNEGQDEGQDEDRDEDEDEDDDPQMDDG